MTNSSNKIESNNFTKSSSSSPVHQNSLDNSFLFVLDLTSSLRFETKREIIKQSVILPILQQFSTHNNLSVTFCGLTGSISLGLFCKVLATFSNDSKSFNEFLNEIDRFLFKEVDKIIDFGATGDSLTGNFGIGGTVESICTSLCHFNQNYPENFRKHLILLPTSFGTEILPLFRTCYDDNYASASLPQLLSILRTRKISLSLIAPGLGDSTVVEQFIVFKCNEKIGNASKLSESLGSDWVVRLSAGLTGDESTTPTPKAVDENELLNQTLIKLSTMPPDERVVALKTLLDPATSTFSSSFRQKFAAAVKSRLQSQESSSSSNSTVNSNPNQSNQNNQSNQSTLSNVLPVPPSRPVAFSQRRASNDSSTIFWNGCIRFMEKQQTFIFRVQFVAVESQSLLPSASLENWPQELNLTGLLDSKKESIQSGLTVGYAFKVNVAGADTAVASYLMTRMCQGPTSNTKNVPSPSHLACFRISQDVLIMLKVLSHDDLQFIGYLIDRRFPKSNLTPASQAASNAINSLTSTLKSPMTTTLSTGMDGLSLGRRPSFDMKNTSFPAKPPVPLPIPVLNSNRPAPPSQIPKPAPTITTNYISYPQFIQQQQQQRSPAKIPAISSTTFTTNQLLTDPQAILQKLRPVVSQRIEPIPPPMQQPNEGNSEQQHEIVDELDQSFVDAWLN